MLAWVKLKVDDLVSEVEGEVQLGLGVGVGVVVLQVEGESALLEVEEVLGEVYVVHVQDVGGVWREIVANLAAGDFFGAIHRNCFTWKQILTICQLSAL